MDSWAYFLWSSFLFKDMESILYRRLFFRGKKVQTGTLRQGFYFLLLLTLLKLLVSPLSAFSAGYIYYYIEKSGYFQPSYFNKLGYTHCHLIKNIDYFVPSIIPLKFFKASSKDLWIFQFGMPFQLYWKFQYLIFYFVFSFSNVSSDLQQLHGWAQP